MKKLLSFSLALILILSTLPVATALNYNGFTYVDNGDGTCNITGYNDFYEEDVVIPSTIKNLKVVSITGFRQKNSIRYVTIPSTVKKIGDMAFYSNGFTGGLEIPISVTAIGNSAFMYNQFNGELITNHTLTNIGVNAFSYNPNLYGKVSVESGTPNDAFYNTKVEVTVV